jgi:hypothetical protein
LLSASISLHPSKKASIFFSFLYLLGIGCVIFSGINLIIKILLIGLIYFDACRVFKQLRAITHLSHREFQWEITKRDGRISEIDLQQLISFRKIVMLRFVENNKFKSIFLFEDNMSRENFHYLLIQARLNA